jgi:hypothetical protein
MLNKTSSRKRPGRTLKAGMGSICLPLSPAYGHSTYESWPKETRTMRATFAIHVRDTFTKSQLKQLVQWIHDLDSEGQLRLESVKETSSYHG